MEISAGAIIVNKKGKFLVIQSPSGYWGFPKGHIGKGETLQQTAEREVMEEVGLEIKFLSNKTSKYTYKMKNGDQKQESFFLAATDSPKVVANEKEVASYKWLDYEDVLRILSFEDAKEAFKALIKKP